MITLTDTNNSFCDLLRLRFYTSMLAAINMFIATDVDANECTHKFNERLHCQTLSRTFSFSDIKHELLRKTCPIAHIKKWSWISVNRLLKIRFAIFAKNKNTSYALPKDCIRTAFEHL